MLSIFVTIGLLTILYVSVKRNRKSHIPRLRSIWSKDGQKFIYGHYIDTYHTISDTFICKIQTPPKELSYIEYDNIGIIVNVYSLSNGTFKHVVKIYVNKDKYNIEYLSKMYDCIVTIYTSYNIIYHKGEKIDDN